MVLQIRHRVLEWVPSIEDGNLEDFFDENPEIGEANKQLTDIPHTKMWREEVLFIRQRMQATSDYRENKKVRWIGKYLFEKSINSEIYYNDFILLRMYYSKTIIQNILLRIPRSTHLSHSCYAA